MLLKKRVVILAHATACLMALLMQVMGLEIPMRDLRLMDPALQAWDTYAQILVRDNAMVFSVEHARLIIAADKVSYIIASSIQHASALEIHCTGAACFASGR